MTRYIPIAGTWGATASWVLRDDDPWVRFMAQHDLMPLRGPSGKPFTWTGALNGFWLTGKDDWLAGSWDLQRWISTVPYYDRNIIAHSHGGQLVLLMCARGVEIRTLTTVGTPVRRDVPAAEAAKHICYWQHLHDRKMDWMATLRRLGQLGDGKVSKDRRFQIRGVRNIPLHKIGHSDLLSKPAAFHNWVDSQAILGIQESGAGVTAHGRHP